MTISFNPLNHPAIFDAPIRLANAEADGPHLPFLFFLVSLLRPRVLVESGTASGDSYCGFCQVIAAAGLPTQAYAFLAQPAQQTALRAYHDPLYGSFSRLLEQAPAEGSSQFTDGTIDLVHLIGSTHEMAAWLPKLSARGVLVLSALESLDTETSVSWAQAQATYPNFSLAHGGGLGLLAVGQDVPSEIAALCRLCPSEGDKVRAFFAQLSRVYITDNPLRLALEQHQNERAHESASLHAQIVKQERQLETLQTQLTQRKRQLQHITEKYSEVVNSDAWWMLHQYWAFRRKLIPPGSRREQGLKHGTRVLRILKQFGVGGTVRKFVRRLVRRSQLELLARQGVFKSVRLPASWQRGLQEKWEDERQNPAVDERVLKLIHTRPPITLAELELPEIETAAELALPLPRSTVSVIIPTWNAGDELALLLSSLAAQQGCERTEVIVVDSGSTDATVALAREYGARVIEISQAEFSHSHARNLGANTATGEYLLFMVQDALPASNLWLYELIAAAQRLQVVAATCIESPREDADLLARLLGKLHAEYLEAQNSDRVFRPLQSVSYEELRRNCQLNNVACLIERQVFERYGFQGAYAEDLDLGMRLAQDGQRMAVLQTVKVVHSHNRPAYYHLKRGYVDCTMMQELFADYPAPLPVGLDKLGREALATFQVLEDVVARLAEGTEFPLPLRELSALLQKRIGQAYKNPAPNMAHPFEPSRDPYTQFLARLAALSPIPANGKLTSSAFAQSVSGMLVYLFDYLEGIYEIADAELLAEIGAFLQKMHALQLGSYLASSASDGRAEPAVTAWIEAELRKGV